MRIPGTEYYVILGATQPPNAAASQTLLAAVAAWLSKEFELPVIERYPAVERRVRSRHAHNAGIPNLLKETRGNYAASKRHEALSNLFENAERQADGEPAEKPSIGRQIVH